MLFPKAEFLAIYRRYHRSVIREMTSPLKLESMSLHRRTENCDEFFAMLSRFINEYDEVSTPETVTEADLHVLPSVECF